MQNSDYCEGSHSIFHKKQEVPVLGLPPPGRSPKDSSTMNLQLIVLGCWQALCRINQKVDVRLALQFSPSQCCVLGDLGQVAERCLGEAD